MDALNCHPFVQEEMNSASDLEEYETISYIAICEELVDTDREILPIECKLAIQKKHCEPAEQDLELHSSVIEVLSMVNPSEMKDVQ